MKISKRQQKVSKISEEAFRYYLSIGYIPKLLGFQSEFVCVSELKSRTSPLRDQDFSNASNDASLIVKNAQDCQKRQIIR